MEAQNPIWLIFICSQLLINVQCGIENSTDKFTLDLFRPLQPQDLVALPLCSHQACAASTDDSDGDTTVEPLGNLKSSRKTIKRGIFGKSKWCQDS